MSRRPAPRTGADQPKWFVVATTAGVMEATIIAGRLESLGIPTTIYRESVGATLGLSVGRLGQAQVLVPEKYYELAMATLEPDDLPALGDGEPDD